MLKAKGNNWLPGDRRAITSWEYALIGSLVAIGIVASLTTLGRSTMQPFITLAAGIGAAK